MSEYLVLFDVHELNRKWFEENYDALVEKFDDSFVAVCSREDRDLNGALNILKRGPEIGREPPESKPIEELANTQP